MSSMPDVLFVDDRDRPVAAIEIKAGARRDEAWATELCKRYRERGLLDGLDWFGILTLTRLYVWRRPSSQHGDPPPDHEIDVQAEMSAQLGLLPKEPDGQHWLWFEAAAVKWLHSVADGTAHGGAVDRLADAELLDPIRALQLRYVAAA